MRSGCWSERVSTQTECKYRLVTRDWMARLIGPPRRASKVAGRENAVSTKSVHELSDLVKKHPESEAASAAKERLARLK